MLKTNRVWIALGSNLGDSKSILQQAWKDLGTEAQIELVTLSRPYVTEPVGMKSEHLFLNAVGILETNHVPEQLLVLLQKVEQNFGRMHKTGTGGYQDRLLDLDILYFGERVLKTRQLQIPHPHITERLFVLAPLVEIDPLHRDLHSGKTAETMEEELQQRMKDGKLALQEIKSESWL